MKVRLLKTQCEIKELRSVVDQRVEIRKRGLRRMLDTKTEQK